MSNTINILFTGSFQFPEGMAGTKRVKNLMIELQKLNVTCQVLLLANKSGNNRKGIYQNIPYFSIIPNNSNFLLFPFYFINGFLEIYKSKRGINSVNVFYVYSGINVENFFYVLFSRFIGYKIIVDIVEDFSLNEERVSRWRNLKIWSNIFYDRHLPKLTHGIIVISSFLKKKYEAIDLPLEELPISAGNLFFKKDVELKYIKTGFVHLLYSGSYGKKDGIDTLLAAFKKVLIDNEKVKLVLTGNVPVGTKELIRHYKLENEIIYTGFLNETQYYTVISECDILCMTRINSQYANAGFPFKLGEYLATANPVIATDVSDVNKYLLDEVNAYLIAPGNTEALYQKIYFVIKNIQKAKEVGLRGRQTAYDFFNPEVHAQQLVNFIINKI